MLFMDEEQKNGDEITDMFIAHDEKKEIAEKATARIQQEQIDFTRQFKVVLRDLVFPALAEIRDNPEAKGRCMVEGSVKNDRAVLRVKHSVLEITADPVRPKVQIEETHALWRLRS